MNTNVMNGRKLSTEIILRALALRRSPMFWQAVTNLAIRWRLFLYQTENYRWQTLQTKNY